MRLSAELLSQAEQRTNPMDDRELVLREWGIPAIENLGLAATQVDTIDLSQNRITRLENFPRLLRLTQLLCAGNLIESVDARNVGKNLPNLTSLTLSNNNVSSLVEVANIGVACPKLESLSLSGNPVTRRQHYRLYAIHRLPALKVLDFQKVKPSERSRAERLAASAAGAALESDVQVEARRAVSSTTAGGANTFEPGEGLGGGEEDEGGRSFAVANFSTEEKEQIRELLANAASAKEVEEIENAVRRGVLPPSLAANKRKRASEDGPAAAATATTTPGNSDDDEIPAAKRKQT